MVDYKSTYLNTIICSHLLLTLNDRMKETTAYRQRLKHGLKIVTDELEKTCNKEFENIAGKADGVMYSLMDAQQDLIYEIAKLKPHDYPTIVEALKKYNANSSDKPEEKEGQAGAVEERVKPTENY